MNIGNIRNIRSLGDLGIVIKFIKLLKLLKLTFQSRGDGVIIIKTARSKIFVLQFIRSLINL